MWPMIIAAAAALAASRDQQLRAKKDRELAAATERYAPWTGKQAGPISAAPSTVGALFQAGATGYGAQQATDAAEQTKAFQNAQMGNMNAQTNWLQQHTPGFESADQADQVSYEDRYGGQWGQLRKKPNMYG